MNTTTPLHDHKQLKERFEKYLFSSALEGLPTPLLEPVLHIMRMKAKRIRPVLLMAACEAFGGSHTKALEAAAAIEFYHNFTLVHDDIIDESLLRRNEPTVHHRFGLNQAILTGDVMSLHAIRLLSHVDPESYFRLLNIFIRISSMVIEGETLDVDFESRQEVAVKDYVQMIQLKTASFLAGALQMGSILGGANEADATLLYRFGDHLGIAFQIKDDLLDAFGDEKTFGKKIGGDIIQNKKTYLISQLLSKADAAGRQKVFDLFALQDPTAKVDGMIRLFKDWEVEKDTHAAMEYHYRSAISALEQVSLPAQRMSVISDMARRVYFRHY